MFTIKNLTLQYQADKKIGYALMLALTVTWSNNLKKKFYNNELKI
jgi:hypothetical protein